MYMTHVLHSLIVGWQPRWFVLEAGILSYYLSHDEATQGSRGALKVISCDVNGKDHDCVE